MNLGKRGARVTMGLPGTGLSWSERVGAPSPKRTAPLPVSDVTATADVAPGPRWLGPGPLLSLGIIAGVVFVLRAGERPSSVVSAVAQSVPVRTLAVLPRAANCRASPDVLAKRTATLARGTPAEVVEEVHGWAKVYLVPEPCWVRRDLLAAQTP